MSNGTKFSPELRERAVRMVQEGRSQCPSLWKAVTAIAPKIGCAPTTLLSWVKRVEIDSGQRPEVSTEERERIKVERENKELKRANEILQLAPSCYWRHAARRRNPALRSRRAKRDAAVMLQIQRVFDENWQVYGARKIWFELYRQGIQVVARCTVARLMRRMGLQGARRGTRVRTTVPDAKQPCPLDLVDRNFHATRPTSCGWWTSHTCPPGRAGCTWPLLPMRLPAASPAGRPA